MAKIYDPLGLVSPLTLGRKLLYRDACEARVAWDAQLPGDLTSRWAKWERGLPGREDWQSTKNMYKASASTRLEMRAAEEWQQRCML